MGNRDIFLKYTKKQFYFTCFSKTYVEFGLNVIGADPSDKPLNLKRRDSVSSDVSITGLEPLRQKTLLKGAKPISKHEMNSKVKKQIRKSLFDVKVRQALLNKMQEAKQSLQDKSDKDKIQINKEN